MVWFIFKQNKDRKRRGGIEYVLERDETTCTIACVYMCTVKRRGESKRPYSKQADMDKVSNAILTRF